MAGVRDQSLLGVSNQLCSPASGESEEIYEESEAFKFPINCVLQRVES